MLFRACMYHAVGLGFLPWSWSRLVRIDRWIDTSLLAGLVGRQVISPSRFIFLVFFSISVRT